MAVWWGSRKNRLPEPSKSRIRAAINPITSHLLRFLAADGDGDTGTGGAVPADGCNGGITGKRGRDCSKGERVGVLFAPFRGVPAPLFDTASCDPDRDVGCICCRGEFADIGAEWEIDWVGGW